MLHSLTRVIQIWGSWRETKIPHRISHSLPWSAEIWGAEWTLLSFFKQRWEGAVADQPPGGSGALPLEWLKQRHFGTILTAIKGKRNRHCPSRRLVLVSQLLLWSSAVLPVEQLPLSGCTVELHVPVMFVCWSTRLGILAPTYSTAWRIGRKYPLPLAWAASKPFVHIIPPCRGGWGLMEAPREVLTHPFGWATHREPCLGHGLEWASPQGSIFISFFFWGWWEKIPKAVPKQNMETARHNHRMEGEGSGTEKTSLKVIVYFQRQFWIDVKAFRNLSWIQVVRASHKLS